MDARFHSYLRNALVILDQYDGIVPFQGFIKNFFSEQKKFGSTDRRTITQLCYAYFRLGKALLNLSKDERILISLLLSSSSNNPVLKALRPAWDELTALPLAEKISKAKISFGAEDIFPWTGDLSAGVEGELFCLSFLKQPKLFLRLRPGMEATVKSKLQNGVIPFEELGTHALTLPASSKLDSLIQFNREAVVQDLSSQRVAEFFPTLQPGSAVWDCCAGSGGKSILLYDYQPRVQLTVSDKRESILANLKTRFKEAGIVSYKALVLDLEKETLPPAAEKKFDLIMADVPCSGSGTWARTPEQLFFHQLSNIDQFQQLQRNILKRIIPMLGKESQLLYITCSVFKQENEDNVNWAVQNFGLKINKLNVIAGYKYGADTMFAALLTL